MDGVLFTFESLTLMNKAKKILTRSNIQTEIGKFTGGDGCAYTLKIRQGDYFNAVKALRENNIFYKVVKSKYDIS